MRGLLLLAWREGGDGSGYGGDGGGDGGCGRGCGLVDELWTVYRHAAVAGCRCVWVVDCSMLSFCLEIEIDDDDQSLAPTAGCGWLRLGR